LSEADHERRIRIARLTARPARKYRTTLKLIELADSDLRTASVAARLGITRATLRRYRKEAPETIAKVETHSMPGRRLWIRRRPYARSTLWLAGHDLRRHP